MGVNLGLEWKIEVQQGTVCDMRSEADKDRKREMQVHMLVGGITTNLH